nr:EOG090X0LFN [Artemia franciscana]
MIQTDGDPDQEVLDEDLDPEAPDEDRGVQYRRGGPEAQGAVEVYLEKQNAQNKDYLYLQYDPAELFEYHYKDQKKVKVIGSSTSSTAGTATVWKAAAFKEDQDGKMTAKFKRLMGMKGNEDLKAPPVAQDVLKKQDDLFTNLDMQYERARAATHTAKGMGLGFGSLGPSVPR